MTGASRRRFQRNAPRRIGGSVMSQKRAVSAPSSTMRCHPWVLPALGARDGLEFCRELPARCGVVAVPMQVFHTDPSHGRHLVRFTFGKRDEVLDEAVVRLRALRG